MHHVPCLFRLFYVNDSFGVAMDRRGSFVVLLDHKDSSQWPIDACE